MFRMACRCGWPLPLLLAAVFAADVSAQGPRSNSKVITWQTTPTASGICVGVLGEIARPGVYRLDAASLSVQSIVRRAGGFTDEASLTIRIVRQDRVIQSLFFSPQADSRLLPGDLLVVESKRAQSAIGKVMDLDPRASAIRTVSASSAEPAGVQVAFLNVLDQPVIVKLRHEDARLDHVVQMLGQPVELAQYVKILGPERASTQMTMAATGSPKLADGSVLLFPKGSIQPSKLPALPKPIDSDISAGAQPSLIGSPLGQSAELRNVGQLAPLVARPFAEPAAPEPSFNHITAPIQAPPPPIAPQFEQQPSSMVSSPSRIATVPFTGMPRLTTSASRNETEPESNAPTPKDDAPSPAGPSKATGKTTAQSDANLDALLDDENSTASSHGSGPFSIWQMLGIFGCVATLIGLSLLARRHFDGQLFAGQIEVPSKSASPLPTTPSTSLHSTEQPAPPETPNAALTPDRAATPDATATASATAIPVVATSLADGQFDRLIRNELPLRQEQPEFPEAVVLQGRIAPRMIHRTDAAAVATSGAGPHFPVKAPLAGEAAAHDPTIAEESDEPGEPQSTEPKHFGRRREVAQPVSLGESSRREGVAFREATHPTPLADALRQLQGGQS